MMALFTEKELEDSYNELKKEMSEEDIEEMSVAGSVAGYSSGYQNVMIKKKNKVVDEALNYLNKFWKK